jgi:hypothetical protein
MMSLVVRGGDANTGGGLTIPNPATCSFTVLANFLPICGPFTPVTPHPCCGPYCWHHCAAFTTLGSPTVLAEFKPVVFVGSPDTCGHIRMTGAPNVIVGAVGG